MNLRYEISKINLNRTYHATNLLTKTAGLKRWSVLQLKCLAGWTCDSQDLRSSWTFSFVCCRVSSFWQPWTVSQERVSDFKIWQIKINRFPHFSQSPLKPFIYSLGLITNRRFISIGVQFSGVLHLSFVACFPLLSLSLIFSFIFVRRNFPKSDHRCLVTKIECTCMPGLRYFFRRKPQNIRFHRIEAVSIFAFTLVKITLCSFQSELVDILILFIQKHFEFNAKCTVLAVIYYTSFTICILAISKTNTMTNV